MTRPRASSSPAPPPLTPVGASTDPAPKSASADVELAAERAIGESGVDVDASIPLIDLAGDQATVDAELWDAATHVGFFQVVNHGIDPALVDAAFAMSEAFFALPSETKERWALRPGTNAGWEYRSQRRPSTGTLDQKESYQVTRSRMDALGLWPTDEDLAGFRQTMDAFEQANWRLAMRLLSSIARALGFDDDFFTLRHDPASPTYQSTLRLLHYLALDGVDAEAGTWRAGAHTDFDCLTLLHQLPGQHGLQVSSGERAGGGEDGGGEVGWVSVQPLAGVVTCNIGDMLVRWSDDALRSTWHRVRMPRAGEYLGPRYSLAYFAQADTDAVIQGPTGRYEPITAGEYLVQRVTANAL